VKAFAELIGAAIEVESELGKGTEFTVWLPTGTGPDRVPPLRGVVGVSP
jgi:signal transduction histidine kinase